METRWECVAGGCQSTYLGISQSEQGRLVSGQNLTVCNTGSRSRPVRVSLPFLTKIQRLGNGMRGSRVIVRPHFKGHYNGIAYTCAASSRSSGSAKEDVREGTGAKQEIGGCINGETKTTKTKDATLPGIILHLSTCFMDPLSSQCYNWYCWPWPSNSTYVQRYERLCAVLWSPGACTLMLGASTG